MIGHNQHGAVDNKSCLTNLLSVQDDLDARMDRGDPFNVSYGVFRKPLVLLLQTATIIIVIYKHGYVMYCRPRSQTRVLSEDRRIGVLRGTRSR